MNGSAQETFRIGIVTKVNNEKMLARVKFEDKDNLTSGELCIMRRPRHVIPQKAIYVDPPEEDKTKISGNHEHKAWIDEWIPKVGAMVVCLIIPYGDGDGVILGQIGE